MAEFRHSSSALQLRNPEQGNTLTLNLRTQIKRAMDGTFWTSRTTPMIKTLSVTFKHHNRNKILEAEQFFLASAGQEVGYIDHNERLWKGKVINHPFESVHEGRKNNEFTIQLEVIRE